MEYAESFKISQYKVSSLEVFPRWLIGESSATFRQGAHGFLAVFSSQNAV